jgi:hypothetical protein
MVGWTGHGREGHAAHQPVLNAVPEHRTGVASGINNAVAAVGGLLAIAVLGTLALGLFDRALDAQLARTHETPGVTAAVQAARGGFVIPALPPSLSAGERERVHRIVTESLAATVGHALWAARSPSRAHSSRYCRSQRRRRATPCRIEECRGVAQRAPPGPPRGSAGAARARRWPRTTAASAAVAGTAASPAPSGTSPLGTR